MQLRRKKYIIDDFSTPEELVGSINKLQRDCSRLFFEGFYWGMTFMVAASAVTLLVLITKGVI